MPKNHYKARQLHYELLYQYALLEAEFLQKDQAVPRLRLSNPERVIAEIKRLRLLAQG